MTTIVESFIEGIAFTMTLQDDIIAGITVYISMIIKLIPQEIGNAVVLSHAGVNHYWENILTLIAVAFIYIGALLGMLLYDEFSANRAYFFAALVGMFLYLSLGSLFPVLQDLIDEPPNKFDVSNSTYAKAARKQSLMRLLSANFGFMCSLVIIFPLVCIRLKKHHFRTSSTFFHKNTRSASYI